MSLLTISKKANSNYLARMFKLEKLEKHPNADKLAIAKVDHMPVITSKDITLGSYFIYFPTESRIDSGLLHSLNAYRDPELNANKTIKGFFEANGRVKTIKLRGSYSSGYIIPVEDLESYIGKKLPRGNFEFDTVDDLIIVKKNIIKYIQTPDNMSRSDKKALKLNILEGQFKFHEDTDNLRRTSHMILPESNIEVTYKLHGTSAIVGKVLFEKKPTNWFSNLLFKMFKNKPKTYYDTVWSSRKVIKNKELSKGYYDEDVWTNLKNSIEHKIPDGYTVYGEIVGYQNNGVAIQKDYDYGNESTSNTFYVYRISKVDADNYRTELSYDEIKDFVIKYEIGKIPKLFFKGTALSHFKQLSKKYNNLCKDTVEKFNVLYDEDALIEFQDKYVTMLEMEYNEKNCYMCKNKVPEEGIVLRVLNTPEKFEAYKLKSLKFLERETKSADKGEINLEDNN